MRSTFAIGIVGCGYWGPNLARNFDRISTAKLAAVCDTSPARLSHMMDLHPDAEAYHDFETMLQDADLDAVAITTPLKSHHSLAKAALEAGMHVLVEKPLAESAEQCEELMDLARAKGLTLMVGHTYLFSEPVRKLSGLIRSGEIGELRYVNCQRLNLGLFKGDINVAWDLAPHDISIVLHVMGGLPNLVNCQGYAHLNPEMEDVTNLSLTFPGGRFATIQSSWLEPRKVRQMTFVGTKKMIVYDDLQPLEPIRIYDVRVDPPPHYDSFAEFHYSYHYGDCLIPHVGHTEPLRTMCSHFIDCIAEGRVPDSCGAKGLEVVKVLEACSLSLKAHGAPVRFPVLNLESSADRQTIVAQAGLSAQPCG
jgi:predicted dehydrogenase